MFSEAQLLGFMVAALVMIVIPGPGVLFVVGRALAHGRRTALATAAGHGIGNLVVGACVAFGLGAVLQRSAEVFTAVKLAGAAYLVWLGVQAIRKRSTLELSYARGESASAWRSVWDGIVVGVTNPKTYILLGAILPQFVNREGGHVPLQMLLLSALCVAVGVASDTAWAFAASGLRSWFARSPRRFSLVGGAGGLAMIGVGLTVALTGRKS